MMKISVRFMVDGAKLISLLFILLKNAFLYPKAMVNC